jgi:hypothetical protein
MELPPALPLGWFQASGLACRIALSPTFPFQGLNSTPVGLIGQYVHQPTKCTIVAR